MRIVLFHPDPRFDEVLVRASAGIGFGVTDPAALAGAANRVSAGDLPGWERYWRGVGERHLMHADERLCADDIAGAREGLLCAASAFGLAGRFVGSDRTAEVWARNRMAQAAAFRAALPLLPYRHHEISTASSPSGVVFGYLVLADPSTGGCVVIASDGTTTSEDGYLETGAPALARGMHCLTVELPAAGARDALSAAMRSARRLLPVGTVFEAPSVTYPVCGNDQRD